MTIAFDPLFQTKWNNEIQIRSSQKRSKLRGTVTEIPVENADTFKLNVTGSLGASQTALAPGEDLTYMNPAMSNVVLVAQLKLAPVFIPDVDMVKVMSMDAVRHTYTEQIIRRLNSDVDQFIIDALNTTPGLTPISLTNDTLDETGLDTLARALGAVDAEETDRYLITSQAGLHDLVTDSTVNNNFNLREQVVANGRVTKANSFTVIDHNSLPLIAGSPTKHTTFGYHKSAVTLAVFKDIDVQIERVAHKLGYQVVGSLQMAAGIGDPTMVVAANVKDA